MGGNSEHFKRSRRTTRPRTLRMQLFLIAIVLALVAVSARTASAQPSGLTMSVRAVLDGDTIRIGGRRVSLLGISAPRLGGSYEAERLARQARDRLSSLVLWRFVRLEYDGQQRGRAYVFTEDGVFVNAEIVRAGLARVTALPTLKRLAVLRAAEAEARDARRGIWGVGARVQ